MIYTTYEAQFAKCRQSQERVLDDKVHGYDDNRNPFWLLWLVQRMP